MVTHQPWGGGSLVNFQGLRHFSSCYDLCIHCNSCNVNAMYLVQFLYNIQDIVVLYMQKNINPIPLFQEFVMMIFVCELCKTGLGKFTSSLWTSHMTRGSLKAKYNFASKVCKLKKRLILSYMLFLNINNPIRK